MRALLVDDSAFMRTALTGILRREGDIEVRTARDGREALQAIAEFDPDVVTLDINMPAMDGLTCLSHIMTASPRPVVMVSSLTTQSATATFEALAMGAVDFVTKPSGTVSLDVARLERELVAKVRSAASAKVARGARTAPRPAARPAEPPRPAPAPGDPAGVVLVGSSTGGPRALEEVLTQLPAGFPWAVVVAQHMPDGFTRALAERLDAQCAVSVREVSGITALSAGEVVIGRGDADVVLSRRSGRLSALSVPSSAKYLWHPSVDRLVRSAMEVSGATPLAGVLLTGMGDDGAAALRELCARGGTTYAESEASCVVNGMPGALVRLGGATSVLAARAIGAQLARTLTARKPDHGTSSR